jgi:hypothetical protein
MLTKSYPLDEKGRWRRRMGDFVEDVVIVCAACGVESEGSVDAQGEEFVFTPETGHVDHKHGQQSPTHKTERNTK